MNRRALILGLGTTLAAPALAARARDLGLDPNSSRDQSRRFQQVLDEASRAGRPVMLPPGTYRVSDIRLPSRVALVGIAGTARLVQSGGAALMTGEGCERVVLDRPRAGGRAGDGPAGRSRDA